MDGMTRQSLVPGQLCPPSVQTVPLAMSLHLYSLEIEKVSRDGSRALGRAARVELRSRRAGWCASPAGCRGQVDAGISPPLPPAFLPPTNRMSQTDTRTLGPEKGLGKYGARGENCKTV